MRGTGCARSMPVLNGVKATEAIKASCPETQVPVLTRHAGHSYLQQMLRLVAWGYSNKEVAAQLGLSGKIETHKANASQKLGLRNRIDLVRFALLRGWLEDA